MGIYKNKSFRIIKTKIYVKTKNHEGTHKKRCVNLDHWFVTGITFSYVNKIFGSRISLHYENTLFRFLFHLQSKLPVKTVLKFQRYYPSVNKVTYLLPKLSTVENLITLNITNKSCIFV